MTHIQSEREIVIQPSCCNLQIVKKGIYGTAVILVALAVIFGVLVLITEHYKLNWGSLNDSMQHLIQTLGKYSFVPLAISTPLLIVLIVGGILFKKSESKGKEIEETRDVIQPTLHFSEVEKALNKKMVTNPTRLLQEAALEGNEELVAKLLEQGAPLQNEDSGFSAIHFATRCEDKEMALAFMYTLIQKDHTLANAKTKGTHFTPLHIAVSADVGALERVKLLVENGADINVKDHNGYTPLLTTVIRGNNPNIEVIEYLIEKNAELNEDLFIKNIFEFHADWLEEPEINTRLLKCGIFIPD